VAVKDYKYRSMWIFFVPGFICPDCEKQMFHENETTLNIEKGVYTKFCPNKAKLSSIW